MSVETACGSSQSEVVNLIDRRKYEFTFQQESELNPKCLPVDWAFAQLDFTKAELLNQAV
jgi:hypothetical protein